MTKDYSRLQQLKKKQGVFARPTQSTPLRASRPCLKVLLNAKMESEVRHNQRKAVKSSTRRSFNTVLALCCSKKLDTMVRAPGKVLASTGMEP